MICDKGVQGNVTFRVYQFYFIFLNFIIGGSSFVYVMFVKEVPENVTRRDKGGGEKSKKAKICVTYFMTPYPKINDELKKKTWKKRN